MEAWQVWLILAVFLAIGEIFTAGFFIVWFALGALVATAAALSGLNTYWQISLFLLASFLLVVFTRPIVQRFASQRASNIKTNLDALEGQEGLVLNQIDNMAGTGQVRLQGEVWSARSADGGKISAGEKVLVTGVDGVKLLVKPNN